MGGLDGLDGNLRVVVGIEHLTVLINGIWQNKLRATCLDKMGCEHVEQHGKVAGDDFDKSRIVKRFKFTVFTNKN